MGPITDAHAQSHTDDPLGKGQAKCQIKFARKRRGRRNAYAELKDTISDLYNGFLIRDVLGYVVPGGLVLFAVAILSSEAIPVLVTYTAPTER
jgi:hypothetical protein